MHVHGRLNITRWVLCTHGVLLYLFTRSFTSEYKWNLPSLGETKGPNVGAHTDMAYLFILRTGAVGSGGLVRGCQEVPEAFALVRVAVVVLFVAKLFLLLLDFFVIRERETARERQNLVKREHSSSRSMICVHFLKTQLIKSQACSNAPSGKR